ncbi:hypothetical protein M0811_11284 [Anaeramoeba ignava]|uniref:PH domain-containing protein n=1 Tax=Anaeramoeba ignava TaxID=1746090 RepID=A0A9Q0LDU6_ANAIG|nr:hypothetical protein M0811_11284 [Anaeramoeba ignava]
MIFLNEEITPHFKELDEFFMKLSDIKTIQEIDLQKQPNIDFIEFKPIKIYQQRRLNDTLIDTKKESFEFFSIIEFFISNQDDKNKISESKLHQFDKSFKELKTLVEDFGNSNKILRELNHKLVEIKQLVEKTTNLTNKNEKNDEKEEEKEEENLIWKNVSVKNTKFEGFVHISKNDSKSKKKGKKRYLILKENVLAIFESKPEEKNIFPLNVIEIDDSLKVSRAKSTNLNNAISLFSSSSKLGNKKDFFIICETKQDFSKWISLIRKAKETKKND